MSLQLKDYAQYYIGCRCFNTWFSEGHIEYDRNWELSGYVIGDEKPYLLQNEYACSWTDSIKPILRKLCDITHDDLRDLIIAFSRFDLQGCEFEYDSDWVNAVKNGKVIDSLSIEINGVIDIMDMESKYIPQAEVFAHLLKKQFDLFSLIENSLAIDSKTLTT